jgi:outer membrane protein, heavy metal efflux system
MKRAACGALGLAMFAALLAAAETPPASVNLSDGISAREAVALALARNRQLLAFRKARAVAKGAVSEAKALPDPELRTGRFDFENDQASVWSQNYSLALRWSPPRPWERGLKGNQALGKVSEVEGDIASSEQRLAAEVRLLHMSAVFLDEQIKLADASLKLRERIVEFVAAQVGAGVKNALDQNIAELALADARSQPDAYRLDRRLALMRLAAELDLPNSGGLRIQVEGDPLSAPQHAPVTVSLMETALARRPEFSIAAARSSQVEALLDLRKKERYPWVSFVQFSREFARGGAPDTWGFRLGVDLPVFKWSGYRLRAPQAEIEQRQLETNAVKSRINLEIEELTERLREVYRELQSLRKNVEPLAGRGVEFSERVVAAGQGDQLLRLTAEARLISRRQAALSKLYDYRRLEIELDRALGNAIVR